MRQTRPLYEFRAFPRGFGLVEKAIRRYGGACYRESLEVYLMSAGNDENDTKVRGGLPDIKGLVRRDRGLEQQSPRLKREFPLTRQTILDGCKPLNEEPWGAASPGTTARPPELKRPAVSLYIPRQSRST